MDEAQVAVIGGGPGGYVCAIRAGQLGLKTVLIESDRVGGECLNYGCIPSKSLITVSRLLDKVREAERYGLKTTGASVDFAQMQKWKSEVVARLVGGVEALLRGNHVDVIKGEAQVKTRDKILVTTANGTQDVSAANLVF